MTQRWPQLPTALDRGAIILSIPRGDLVDCFEENDRWIPSAYAHSRDVTPTESDHTLVNEQKYERFFEIPQVFRLKKVRPIRGKSTLHGLVFGSGQSVNDKPTVHFRLPGGKGSPYAKISRQHFLLGIDPDTLIFYIVLLGQSMLVNGLDLTAGYPQIALNPCDRNDIVIAGFHLGIYLCKPGGWLAHEFKDHLGAPFPRSPLNFESLEIISTPDSVVSSSLATSRTVGSLHIEIKALKSRHYPLDTPIIISQSQQHIQASIHALECKYIVIKQYAGRSQRVEEQYGLIRSIQDDISGVVKYHSLDVFLEQTTIVTELILGAKTLQQLIEEDEELKSAGNAVRFLLSSLLTIVSALHKNHIIHGDISPATVLVKHLDILCADIMLTGFSEIRVSTGAKDPGFVADCRQIFNVAIQVQDLTTPDSGGLRHPYLDDLMQKAREGTLDVSVVDVCDGLERNPISPWGAFRVSRNPSISWRNGQVRGSDLMDILDSLMGPTIAWSEQNFTTEINKIVHKAKQYLTVDGKALDWVPARAFKKMANYLWSHGKGLLSLSDLSIFQDPESTQIMPIMEAYIPFHMAAGMVNLSKLLKFSGKENTKYFIESPVLMTHDLCEVLGDHQLEGYYVPLVHLKSILGLLNIKCDNYPVCSTTKMWPDAKKHIILAHHRLGDIGILSREHSTVEWGSQTIPLDTFCSEYLHENRSLKGESFRDIEYKPWRLKIAEKDPSLVDVGGSFTTQTGSSVERFQFRKKKQHEVEEKTKDQEVQLWLEEIHTRRRPYAAEPEDEYRSITDIKTTEYIPDHSWTTKSKKRVKRSQD